MLNNINKSYEIEAGIIIIKINKSFYNYYLNHLCNLLKTQKYQF